MMSKKEHNGNESCEQGEVRGDLGSHYRFTFHGYNLDPFAIAKVYGMKSFALMTVLKKVLVAGERGHKDYLTDLRDCICALEREIEMINEVIEEEDEEENRRFNERNRNR
jgi:hypothetical protein